MKENGAEAACPSGGKDNLTELEGSGWLENECRVGDYSA